MDAFTQRARDMLVALEGVGITATLDVRKVNPPCALVVPPDFRKRRAAAGADGVDVAWTVHLLAPGAADYDAAAWLLEHVLPAFDAVGGLLAEFGGIELLPGADPLPGYTITVDDSPLGNGSN